MINIASPFVGKEEKRAVVAVLDSGALAQGKVVEEFEHNFSEYISTKFCSATTNGTTALHLGLLALGLKKDDEVITTAFTFIASANSILYCDAKPVFVDIDPTTFNINPDLIEAKITAKTKAIMVVHMFGLACDMDKIMQIAKKYNLLVIEDACQAHGAEYKGKRVGSIGNIGCFSFYPTKNMTTGEGGAVTTNSEEVDTKIKLLRSHGMKVRYYHDFLGYNFRMTNISAAIGIEQLKKLDDFNKKRMNNAKYLSKHLAKIPGIKVPTVPKEYKHVFHQYTIRVLPEYGLSRDEVVAKLNSLGIGSSIFYPVPIHQQKIYKDLGYNDFLVETEKVSQEVISIPVHPRLKKSDLEEIVKAFQ